MNESEDVMLTCSVYGDPLVRIYWQRDGINITSLTKKDNRISITKVSYFEDNKYYSNSTFSLRDVSIADEGVYTCFSFNLFATVKVSRLVNILGM